MLVLFFIKLVKASLTWTNSRDELILGLHVKFESVRLSEFRHKHHVIFLDISSDQDAIHFG
jgi:hypothetical protein